MNKLIKICSIWMFLFILIGIMGETEVQAVSSIKYDLIKHKDYYKDKNGKVMVKYSYTQLKLLGKSKSVKKINTYLKNKYKKNVESEKKPRFDYAKSVYQENSGVPIYGLGGYQYTSYDSKCKVRYNKNSIFSFYYESIYTANGSPYQMEGYTYNVKTGKRLTIDQVISGSKSQIKKKIVNEFVELNKREYFNDNPRKVIQNKKLKDFKFYINKGNVFVFFNPYEVSDGARGYVKIKIKSIYK